MKSPVTETARDVDGLASHINTRITTVKRAIGVMHDVKLGQIPIKEADRVTRTAILLVNTDS